MKNIALTIILAISTYVATAQKPKNGTYHFDIAYHNHTVQPSGYTCDVIIRGDSILVVSDGSIPDAAKGQPIDGGRLMIHKKTGKWVIGHTPAARFAAEAGGCEGGPTIIDFKRKRVWLC